MTVNLLEKKPTTDTSWIDASAEQNRPRCPSCGHPMKRTGNRLWKSGEFRAFKYSCIKCDKYIRLNIQETGYHEPPDVDWKVRVAKEHCPWCCGKLMQRKSSHLREGTGVRTFRYMCSVCRSWKTVKVYEPVDLPANPTLEALDPKRVDELIRSKSGNNEDCIQDAWLAVLEQGVTTEDAVLQIAEKTSRSRRSQFIRDEHTNVSLSELGTLREGEPEAQDKLKVLATEGGYQEEVVDEPDRCPHCLNRNTLVATRRRLDKKGARKCYLCRACWRFTLWPRKQPYRQQGRIHIAEVKEGDEVDLSSVSRSAVAKAAHCTPAYVSALLCGHATASLPLFYDIAKAIGCTMDELFRTVSGANGKNPASIKTKYTVAGKGYYNLREAALSLGVELRRPTHYKELSPELQAQITRNRPWRGR